MTTLTLEQPDDLNIVTQRGAHLPLVLKFSAALTGHTLILTVRDSNRVAGTTLLTKTVSTFTTDTLTDDTASFAATAQEMSAIPAGVYFYTIQEQLNATTIATRMRGIFEVQGHAGVNLV